MSWKASAYVLDLAREHTWLSVTQLVILYALGARHHQDDHCAWGQLPRIMEDTHCSESTVSHVLAELEERGLITVWEGQIPRRKGDPTDRRRTRGLFYCFVGLDPDDGPAYEDVTRHVRRGGASAHRPKNSVANGATEFDEETGPDELQQSSLSNSVAAPAELHDANAIELQGEHARPVPAGSRTPAGLKPDLEPAPPISPPQAGGDLKIIPNGDGRARRERGPDGDFRFAVDIWRGALDRLRGMLTPAHFEAYLAGTMAVSFDVERLVLLVVPSNPFHVPWLLGKLQAPIESAVAEEVGCPVRVEWSGQEKPERVKPAPRLGPRPESMGVAASD